jgi:two-component system, OmpR family, alkaline phosphatase synthesis response regulator PhoP
MVKPTVLVVEDDPDIQELLAYNLKREGYTVLAAVSAEAGRRQIEQVLPEIIVLDIMLPGMDGLEFLRELKQSPRVASVPVIMLTAKGEDTDVVSGLELGADDYVTKPFSPRVLVARIRACLRKGAPRASREPVDSGLLEAHGLSLDPLRHEAAAEGRALELSATEFAILETLMRDPGRVYTRQQIIDAVKGPDYPVTERSVDVQILGLRKKLGSQGDCVETVRGIGYKLRRA